MAKLYLFWDIFQKMSKRHPIFTIVTILWILSPFDDLFLPVIDEVILVLIWAWQAWKDHSKSNAKKTQGRIS